MNLLSWDLFVIIAYLLTMLGVGLVFFRFNRNAEDYFRSGSQGSWWMVGMSIFMGAISAVTFTGNGGVAFEAGWSILIVYSGGVVAYLLHAFVFAPWYRQMRVTTVPEAIAQRFGVHTQQVYAWLTVVLSLCQATVWLLGISIYSASALNIPVEYSILVLGLVVLFYSTCGGKWAVMAADFLQGIVMMVTTCVLTLLCLQKAGGLSGFFGLIQERGLSESFSLIKSEAMHGANSYTLSWAASIFFLQMLVVAALPQGSRYFSIKDGREARKAAAFVAVLTLVGAAIWFIPPITARLLFESEVLASGVQKPPEAAYAIISSHLLPAGLIGMMVVAMLSATLSSMDGGLNGNAAIIMCDIWPVLSRRFGWRTLSTTGQLRAGRWVTILCGLFVIVLAFQLASVKGRGIFELVMGLAAFLVLPMSVPLVLGLFIRRSPWFACLCSVVAGLTPSVLAYFVGDGLTIQEQVLWVLGCGVAGYFLPSLFSRSQSPEYRAQVDDFFARMHRPVRFDEEVGENKDGTQLRLMGWFTVGGGLFVLLLLFAPNPPEGRRIILGFAAAMLLIGATMVVCGRNKGRRGNEL